MPVVNDLVADRTNLCELAVRQLVKGLSVEAASRYPPKAGTGRMKRQAMTPHAATARVITAIIGRTLTALVRAKVASCHRRLRPVHVHLSY
jgi:hypothetical protein